MRKMSLMVFVVSLSNVNVIGTTCSKCDGKYGEHDIKDCPLHWLSHLKAQLGKSQ